MFGDAAWRDNKMAKSAVHVRALTYCDIHMERLILDRRIRTSNMLKSLFQVALSLIPSLATLGHSDGFTHPTRLYPFQRPATGHSFGCVNLSRIMQPRILAFVGLNTHGIINFRPEISEIDPFLNMI